MTAYGPPVGLSACPPVRPSIRLMLMRSHGPDRLQRQHVPAPLQLGVAVLALEPQIHELALPPGDVGRDPPFRVIRPARRFDVIVARAEDPAAAGPRRQVQKRTV